MLKYLSSLLPGSDERLYQNLLQYGPKRTYGAEPDRYRSQVLRWLKTSNVEERKLLKNPYEQYITLELAIRNNHKDVMEAMVNHPNFDGMGWQDFSRFPYFARVGNYIKDVVENRKNVYQDLLDEKKAILLESQPYVLQRPEIRDYIIYQASYRELCDDLESGQVTSPEVLKLAELLKVDPPTNNKKHMCEKVRKALVDHVNKLSGPRDTP